MPASTRETSLCRYHYDPLDRLVDCTPFEQTAIQRYYCKTRLATEIQGSVQHTIVQHDDQLLAQQQREGDKTTATLLATDQQRSILNALDATQPHPLAYTPYGHRSMESGLLSLLGFNGERPDPVTAHYHLGNGYRQFNPVLMRFNSPDSWSPFGAGGLNAYTYCGGDPRNRVDPTGHFWGIGTFFRRLFGLKPKIPKSSSLSKNVAMGDISSAKRGSLQSKPSKNVDVDIKKFTQQEINAQADEFQKIQQANRWELVPPNHQAGNYKSVSNEVKLAQGPTSSALRQRYSTDPLGSLAHLERSRNNVFNRLASDSPTSRAQRQSLLKVIDSDIAVLNDRIRRTSNPNTTISI
jgi:RHS repeat-associated protein